ncbi:hypothetical protein ONZ51_g13076 [Trametes cubensis]|uniref:SAP domain-containing protein n=1 Tax=Trametes cubensis TaxID=1111947 RepID=A0AAD7TEQ8_9APHY|nr:hypothetical protein ONZ51_g13076 [Trametes cubensis]
MLVSVQPEDDPFPWTLVLPHPGQTLSQSDRTMKTFELKVTKRAPTMEKLKELLSSYGLPQSGKRHALALRLRGFANDPTEWNNLYIPARQHERGNISQRRATTSHAARRIISQFGVKNPQAEFLPKKGGTGMRAPQPVTESIISKNNAWARKVLAQSGLGERKTLLVAGPQLEEDQSNVTVVQSTDAEASHLTDRCDEHGARQGSSGAGVPVTTSSRSPDKSTTGIRRLERRVVDLNQGVLHEIGEVKQQLSSMQYAMTTFAHRQQMSSMPAAGSDSESLRRSCTTPAFRPVDPVNTTWPETSARLPFNNSEPFPSATSIQPIPFGSNANILDSVDAPGQSSNSLVDPHQPQPAQDLTIATEPDLLHFDFPDGERVTFDKTRVPNPPPVSFSDDISALFKEWHQSDLLKVSGRGIPIKYWPWFYQKRAHIKNYAWDVIRSKWNKWKYIVEERERFASDDAFWAQYSDESGKHLNQQTILARLQKAREEDNKRDAAAALKFFDNDLNHPLAHGYFGYKKRNISSLCSKPEAIARKWRELLKRRPDVADAWRHSLAEQVELEPALASTSVALEMSSSIPVLSGSSPECNTLAMISNHISLNRTSMSMPHPPNVTGGLAVGSNAGNKEDEAHEAEDAPATSGDASERGNSRKHHRASSSAGTSRAANNSAPFSAAQNQAGAPNTSPHARPSAIPPGAPPLAILGVSLSMPVDHSLYQAQATPTSPNYAQAEAGYPRPPVLGGDPNMYAPYEYPSGPPPQPYHGFHDGEPGSPQPGMWATAGYDKWAMGTPGCATRQPVREAMRGCSSGRHSPSDPDTFDMWGTPAAMADAFTFGASDFT